jgi:hypothetical protein
MLIALLTHHVIVTTFNVGCDVPADCRTLVAGQEWAKRSIHNKGRFVIPIFHLNLRTHVSAKVCDTSNGRMRNRKGMPPLVSGGFQNNLIFW